jgi:hypothetical protein
MKCLWVQLSQEVVNGRVIVQCSRCLKMAKVPVENLGRIDRECPRDRRAGVGDSLREIIRMLGFKPKEGCRCPETILEMNLDGPDGCERNFDCYVGKLRKAYAETTTAEATRGAFTALFSGLAFKLDWTDPIPSLIRLAIERARQPTPPRNPS